MEHPMILGTIRLGAFGAHATDPAQQGRSRLSVESGPNPGGKADMATDEAIEQRLGKLPRTNRSRSDWSASTANCLRSCAL
jgi:hypothetical protein